MANIIGVDIGGTFTDTFLMRSDGAVAAAKSPTTPRHLADGVMGALETLAQQVGVDLPDLLSETSYVCHGTTTSLNALVTGDVPKVGFLTTRGHGDAISIMKLEGRYAGLDADHIQDMTRTAKPRPLVPVTLVEEIDERIDYKGAVVVGLDEGGARDAIRRLLDQGVEAIAVSLLWSFLNPAHEKRVREIVREFAPSMYVALSSEVSPRIGEYPRSATTIASSQIGPRLEEYLRPLEQQLHERGFSGSLLVMQANGGVISAREAPARPVSTIGSVLAGGLVGCVELGRQLGHRNIISTDIGGTTFLVGLVVDGKPVTATSMTLNQYTLSTASMKVESIGSGGGAIARLDAKGNLRVGPQSAGASPGPACYGRGGDLPTVTDADVVLGIVHPDRFLGGRQLLQRDLAKKAIERHIAGPLGMSIEDAAAAIYAIENAQAADLVRRVVVSSGYDPRDFVLYSYGGAGPVHCAAYAGELGTPELLVPLGATSATFSAFGLASSDIVLSAELSHPANFPVPADEITAVYEGLEEKLRQELGRQGLAFQHIETRREADVRFTMQLAEVPVAVPNGTLTAAAVTGVTDEFQRRYEDLYGPGSGFPEAGMQLITCRVTAVGQLADHTPLPSVAPAVGAYPVQSRRAYLDPAIGWQEVSVISYRDLGGGHIVPGPAIVEADTTTVVVPGGWTGRVDLLGNLVLSHAAS